MSDLINDVDPDQPEPLPTAPPSGAVPLPEDGPQDLPQTPGSVVTGDADDQDQGDAPATDQETGDE